MSEYDSSDMYAKVLGQVVAYHREQLKVPSPQSGKSGERKLLKMSQGHLADAAGVTQTTISRLERGEVQASVWVVRNIARALQFESVSELLDRVEKVHATSSERSKELNKLPEWLLPTAAIAGLGALGIAIGSAIADEVEKTKKKGKKKG